MVSRPLIRGNPMHPIILIRHGQAEHNLGKLTGGWSSTSLTELGQRQVEALASRLRDELDVPCNLYYSDLRRAAQTAEIIAQETGLTPVPDPGLREFNNGIAVDMTQAEADQYFTPPTDPIVDWQPYPEAETWRRFYVRISECMDALPVGQDRPMVIVAHGGTIVNIIAWWLRLDIDALSYITFRTSPASVSVLNMSDLEERALERLNDTSHLLPLGLSPPIPLSPSSGS